MENVENVKSFIKALDAATNSLSLKLKPILGKPLDEQAAEIKDPIAKIKFYNNYLYVLVSVLFAYFKSTGVDTTTHPIVKELNRVKSYMGRLKELEANQAKKDTSKEDAIAAKNFLQNTLGGRVNGGGAAATKDMMNPAISSGNFGKHTKFSDDEKDQDISDDGASQAKKVQRAPKSNQTQKGKAADKKSTSYTKTSSGRIAKPKPKTKSGKTKKV